METKGEIMKIFNKKYKYRWISVALILLGISGSVLIVINKLNYEDFLYWG